MGWPRATVTQRSLSTGQIAESGHIHFDGHAVLGTALLSPDTSRDRVVPAQTMVSLARTIRSIRRVGLKEWWHQMQYIGDAKSGAFKGKDQ